MDLSIVSVLPTIDDDQPAPSLEKTTGVTAQEQITDVGEGSSQTCIGHQQKT